MDFAEFGKAIMNVATGGVGTYIALVVKDYFDRGGQARTADIEEYKAVRLILNDPVIAALQASDFFGGVDRSRFYDPLRTLFYKYEGGRELIFHDQRLNERFLDILKRADALAMKAAELTIPVGTPPRMSTRTDEDRRHNRVERLRQSQEEARVLDGMADELATTCNAFVDDGKRRLRI
ncbi:hypothetical protein [Caballeronia zhejiangensis]|uniref:hypothetical protein n=1 Tax=Caballeronia zhejiangensis TaxID=871203 RepID=UPI001ABA5355|nr:hypothetical protein [Caballeronia zhejiangensis]